MGFSDNYGKHLDGYWTVGYTTNGEDHEIRFRTVSGEITDFDVMF